MKEDQLKEIAKQLRKPEGEYAIEVGQTMNKGNLHINKYSIEEIDVEPNETVLEIGMGNGFFVQDILSIDSSITYHGCDFSEDMINEASKLNDSFVKNGQAKFHLVEAHKLPVKDNTIDKLFTVNTLYFWDNTTLVFDEIKRVLKTDGIFVIAIRPKDEMINYPMTKYGFNMFNYNELEELMMDNDFTVLNSIEVEGKEQEFLETKTKDKFIIMRVSLS